MADFFVAGHARATALFWLCSATGVFCAPITCCLNSLSASAFPSAHRSGQEKSPGGCGPGLSTGE